MSERSCGTCQLCCRLLAVQALGKPVNTQCVHACGGGCAIYQTRPYACRRFDCLWLLGMGEEHERPDRIHAVWSVIHVSDLVIHEEAEHEGEGRAALAHVITQARAAGSKVYLCVGDAPMRELTE